MKPYSLLLTVLTMISGSLILLPTAWAADSASDFGLQTKTMMAQISRSLPAGTASPTTKTEQVMGYELLVSAAEKVGRELRADKLIRVSGERTRTLWLLPKGAELESTFDSAGALLEGEELFRCAGRDCGRSTAWANLVYNEALLYGQDRYQRYLVVRKSHSELQSVYLVQRGNRRVHLLLETIELQSELSDAALAAGGKSAALALASRGLVDLTVLPRQDGTLAARAIEQLQLTGFQLAGLTSGELYVVCHLYGNTPTEALLKQSESCASAALVALEAGYEEGSASPLATQSNRARPADTRFVAFGAGPLMPRLHRDHALANRIELVLPHHLQRP